MLYAHSRNAHGHRHLLRDHLVQVAQRAAAFADVFASSELASSAGWLHDVGKIHPDFQRYLQEAEHSPSPSRRGPDHKGAGAVWAMQLHLEVLAFLIAGHHGGLPARAELKVWLRERAQDATVQQALGLAMAAFSEVTHALPSSQSIPAFVKTPLEVELYVRLLFSALVDADYLDTEEHFHPQRAVKRAASVSMRVLWNIFEAYQQDQQHHIVPSHLNELRQQVYQQCCEAASWSPGFFRLTVPTGGGKTRSSLAFALLHAATHGLRRIVYAIPYMSITEQTADVFRAIFSDPHIVLEHHSGLSLVDDSQDTAPQLASENWDAPLIVTTTVQLFESLLGCTPSRCRKLHNIAQSVIILDEAQMLPTHLLETMLDVLQCLVRSYGVTVVLCTATQPALDQHHGFPGLQAIREILPDPAPLFTALARVTYQWPQPGERWSWQQVATEIQTVSQALAVVNTRADARTLAHMLPDGVLHLSTSLCGAHRRVVLQEVRRRLLHKETCYLVSTQLIEAGVDLDFPLVLRALGPLDSIAQAAGRCNREGVLQWGRVIVFDPQEGSIPPGSYRTGTMLTQALLRQGVLDLTDTGTYQRYFERYYALVDRDEPRVQAARSHLNYPEVAARFQMIEESQSVIVSYQDSARPTHLADLLQRLEQQPTERRFLLRSLQPYMVTLRPSVFKRAQESKLVQELLPGVWLWKGTYDVVYGVMLNEY